MCGIVPSDAKGIIHDNGSAIVLFRFHGKNNFAQAKSSSARTTSCGITPRLGGRSAPKYDSYRSNDSTVG